MYRPRIADTTLNFHWRSVYTCAYLHQRVVWELRRVELQTALGDPAHDLNVTLSAGSPVKMAAKEPGCTHEAGAFWSGEYRQDQSTPCTSFTEMIHRINTFTLSAITKIVVG